MRYRPEWAGRDARIGSLAHENPQRHRHRSRKVGVVV